MSFIGQGKGTQSDPYRITTAEELLSMGGFPFGQGGDVYYELMNDIDLKNQIIFDGFSGTRFQSNFEGNGYTVSNFRGGRGTYGFFNNIYNGAVRNLTVRNIQFSESSGVGGLTRAISGNSVIENCHIVSFVQNWQNTFNNIGGLANTISGSVVKNCSVNGARLENGYSRNYAGGFAVKITNSIVKNNLLIGDVTVGDSTYAYLFGNGDSSSIVEGNIVANSRQSYGIDRTGFPTSKVARVTANSTNPDHYTSAPLDEPWVFGEEQPWNITSGSTPHPTNYGAKINPVQLTSHTDIKNKMMNPNFRDGLHTTYQLMNDIEFLGTTEITQGSGDIYSPLTQDLSTPATKKDFTGYIEGNGFKIKLPKYTINAETPATKLGLFQNMDRTLINNLRIDWDVTDNSGLSKLFLTSEKAGNTEVINTVLEVSKSTGVSSVSALPNNTTNSIFEDILIDYKSVSPDASVNNNWITDKSLLTSETGTPTRINNIMMNIDTGLNSFPSNAIKTADNSTNDTNISNVLASINGFIQADNANANMSVVDKTSMISGIGTEFDSFRNTWKWNGSELGKPSIFMEIVDKIQSITINSYSKRLNVNLESMRNYLVMVLGFSGIIMSRVERRLKSLRSTRSWTQRIRGKSNKAMKSNIANSTRVFSSFAKRIIPILIESRLVKSFSNKFNTFNEKTMKKKTLRTSYSGKTISNVTSNYLRRVLIEITSKITQISSNIETIKQRIKKIIISSKMRTISFKAHLKQMIGTIGIEVVVSSVGSIGSSVAKINTATRIIRNRLERLESFSFIANSIPRIKEAFAKIFAKFNKNKTAISKNKSTTTSYENNIQTSVAKKQVNYKQKEYWRW